MLRIAPLGTQILLPAFVIGFEIQGESDFRVDELEDLPDWLVVLDQQAGGYSMTYPSVLGAILRFTDNGQHCCFDIGTVTRGFQAMAEDPNLIILQREYPDLVSLVYTYGEDYGPIELQNLQKYLERFFNIPMIESGKEAFVRMGSCDPLEYFAGWRMLTPITKSEVRQLYRNQKSIYIDDSNIGDLRFTSDETFDNQTLQAIREVGSLLRVDRSDLLTQDHLRIFLLWENSD